MKKYLGNIITGISTGITVSIVLAIWAFFENSKDLDYIPKFLEVSSSSASVDKGRLVVYGHFPNITATIKNETNKDLEEVQIKVKLFDSVGHFGTCGDFFTELKPNESRTVSINCHNLKSDKIPKETYIKTNVGRVSILNDS